MLFADTRLAARIEAAECGLLSEGVESTRRRQPDADVFVRPIAGGVAAYGGNDSPVTKVAGLGFAGPIDDIAFDAIERAFAERGAAVQVELANLAEPSIATRLTQRGYVLVGFENVLGRGLTREMQLDVSDIVVSRCTDDEFDEWIDVVVRGFATPDTQGVASHESFDRESLRQVIGDMVSGKSFHRYLARRNGIIAGGASMRVSDGIAQLCGAATLPEHRRRGVQTRLLSVRLQDAANLGGELAVVTVLPGSKSQQNVQRRGFELLYTRAILRREPRARET